MITSMIERFCSIEVGLNDTADNLLDAIKVSVLKVLSKLNNEFILNLLLSLLIAGTVFYLNDCRAMRKKCHHQLFLQ